jgi:hypothetical protein
MTPEQVARAIGAGRGTADGPSVDPRMLLALASIATEYIAASDAWDAASYADAELLSATARLKRAECELRTALGLPVRVTTSEQPVTR